MNNWRVGKCIHCGVEFQYVTLRHQWCSKKCRKDDEYRKGMLDYKWRLKKLVAMAKNRAATQGIPFDIDRNYMIDLWDYQDGKCSISDQPFDLSVPTKYSCNPDAPSIDKIEPKLGYVKGNVRLVCYQVNMALNEYGENKLIEMCKRITYK